MRAGAHTHARAYVGGARIEDNDGSSHNRAMPVLRPMALRSSERPGVRTRNIAGGAQEMKQAKLVLTDGQVCCPCCGYALRVGATIRLKATREIGQMPLYDETKLEAIEEAERHG